MKWLKKLFVEEVNEDTGPSEIAVRVAEIQARIAAFRSSYPWSEQSNKTTKVQPKPVVAQEEVTANNAKNSDLDALRAKLQGNK